MSGNCCRASFVGETDLSYTRHQLPKILDLLLLCVSLAFTSEASLYLSSSLKCASSVCKDLFPRGSYTMDWTIQPKKGNVVSM